MKLAIDPALNVRTVDEFRRVISWPVRGGVSAQGSAVRDGGVLQSASIFFGLGCPLPGSGLKSGTKSSRRARALLGDRGGRRESAVLHLEQ